MAATSTSVSYLTIVVQGKSHDVVAPAGLTLAQVLKIRRVPPDLVPCTVAGDKLPGTLVVGREIRNGALVVLQPPGPDFEVTLEDFKPNAASPEAAFSPAVSIVGMLISVVLSLLVFLRSPLVPEWQALTAAGTMLFLGLLYSLRPNMGHPVSETLAAVTCGMTAGFLATASNPDDAKYQALVSAFAAAGILAAMRWAWRGRNDVATARVAGDCAALGLIVSVGGLAFLLLGVKIELLLAGLFGLSAPLIQALPGFSISIPVERLIDEATIVREARSVRHAEPKKLDKITPRETADLIAAGTARNRLWTAILCSAALVMLPTMTRAALRGGWQGVVAGVSIAFVALAFLLVPRTAAAIYVRVIPRATVAAMTLCGAAFAGARGFIKEPVPPVVVLTCVAFTILLVSIPISRGWRPLSFTRIADIVQSLACAWALPLALAGTGLITLVRTGGTS